MLNKIHTANLGIVKSKKRAKDVLFWPGIGRDIENPITSCEICVQYQASNAKESMMSDDPTTQPWELASTDLFSLNGEDYLFIVDSYSQFIKIVRLHSTSSKLVTEHTKSAFPCYGIPRIVKSDNGPQFTSDIYKKLSEEWGFKHVTTSPYHPQANGLAESKNYQRILKKAKMINKTLL